VLINQPSGGATNSNLNAILAGAIFAAIVGTLLILGSILVIVYLMRKKQKKPAEETMSQTIESRTQEATSLSLTLTSISRTMTIQSQISVNELVIEKEIGEGSYGKVCLGKWNGAVVALKFCKKKGKLEDFLAEVKVMVELPPHPNVVQMFGISLDGPQPIIILEYCGGGANK
jgi:hypothetical protein